MSASDGSLSLTTTALSENSVESESYQVCEVDFYGEVQCYIETNGGLGGALYLSRATLTVEGGSWSGNVADRDGGAAWLKASEGTLSDLIVAENQSGASGGGLYLLESSPAFTRCTVRDNRAADNGGGLYLNDSSSLLSGSLIVANRSDAGGALYSQSSSASIQNCTVAFNVARRTGGSGIQLNSSLDDLTLRNTVVAYNPGYNVFSAGSQPATATVVWSDLYNPVGPNHDLDTLDESVLNVAPGLMRLTLNRDASSNDWHLTPGSPLIDAGDPSLLDPDGSRSDIGAYGGPDADGSYYFDQDGDGLYDGWERLQGLDPSVNDAGQDPDGDGASNALEQGASSPGVADTDGDGLLDGTELMAGADPADWYARPGGVAVAQVPGDFSSVQAAIDAVVLSGTIQLDPGVFSEQLEIYGKRVALGGGDRAEVTTLQGTDGSVLEAVGADLELSGLTLTGGRADRGGGAYLVLVSGAFTDLAIVDNAADYGGGLYLRVSDPRLERLTVFDNAAHANCPYDAYMYSCFDGHGGGMYLERSAPTLRTVVLEGNTARNGGGLYLMTSSPTLDNVAVVGNEAIPPNFGETEQDGNWPTGFGGGLYAYYSAPSIAHTVFADNSAIYYGGGVYLYDSDATLAHSSWTGNTAVYGGGVAMYASSPTVEHCVLTGNGSPAASGEGGGVHVEDSGSAPVFVNNILAYNDAYNLYYGTSNPSASGIAWCDLYSPEGEANHNLSSLDSSNQTVEPGFLSYVDGLPSDLHLALSSPLVNAGDPNGLDADGSRSDPGMYGGDGGDGWDLDGDGFPSWFWPGTIDDAPAGIDAAAYDEDDEDPAVH